MAIHRDLKLGELHSINSFQFANEAERLAATYLTITDVGRVAIQVDNESVWILVSVSPNVWEELTDKVLASETVMKARRIIAGDGLTGDGDLSSDRTLAVGADPAGSIQVMPDYVKVGVINDTQHGNRTGGISHALVTGADHGFMSSTDKTKLDGIEEGATHGVTPTNSTPTNVAAASAVGVSVEVARADHAHGHGDQLGGSTHALATQVANGFLSAADKTKLDNLDTTLATKANDTAVVHVTGAESVNGVKTFGSSPLVPTPSVSGEAANKGYVDAQMSALSGEYGSPVGNIAALRALISTGITDMQLRLVEAAGALFRYDTTGTGADDGVGTIIPSDNPATGRWFKVQAATQDHEALVGLLGGGASDHQHLSTTQVGLLPSAGEKAALVGTLGSPGAANKYVTETDARLSDNRTPTAHAASHLPGGGDPVPTGTPVAVGTTNSPGTAQSLARSDHVHDHGSLSGGSLHALASGPWAGFISGSDKAKLDAMTPAYIPTADEKAALAGTSGTAPSGTNKLVDNADARLTNSRFPLAHGSSHAGGGPDAISQVAPGGLSGLMTGADKSKLDGIAAGAISAANFVDEETPTGTVNGTNAVFTLAFTPASGSLKVYVNGVRYRRGTHYNLSTATITFVAGWIPQAGDLLFVDYRK